jgi:hypothetical protein
MGIEDKSFRDDSELSKLAQIASAVEGKEITPENLFEKQAAAEQEDRRKMLVKLGTLVRYDSNNNYTPERIERFLDTVPEELLRDENFLVEAVRGHGFDPYTNEILKRIPEGLRDKKDFWLKITEVSGLIENASESMRADKDVVTTAIGVRGDAIKYASETLRADKEVVLEAVRRGGWLYTVSETLRGDKDVVMAAVQKYGLQLQYASEELRSDIEVVETAVRRDVLATQYAGAELRNQKHLAMLAVKAWSNSIKYFSEELQNDRDLNLIIIKDGTSYRKELGFSTSFADFMGSVSTSLLGDRAFVEEAMSINPDVLVFASEEIRGDRELVKKCLLVPPNSRPNGWTSMLSEFPDSIRGDGEFVLECLRDGVKPESLRGISDKLRADADFILKAVKNNPKAIMLASDEIRSKVFSK